MESNKRRKLEEDNADDAAAEDLLLGLNSQKVRVE